MPDSPPPPHRTPLRARLRPTGDDREIMRLAVPAFAALVAEPMFLLADTAVVGHLGTAPLAGLSIGAIVLQTVVGLCVFLAYGTTAAVGRHLGAGDLRGAMRLGVSGLWLAALVGVATGGAVLVGADAIVGWFGPSAEVAGHAATYLRWSAPGLPAMLLVLAATGVLRGMQDVRTPLAVAVVANLANIGLNVTLVYGLDLGIAGAALGTSIAQWFAATWLLVVVLRGVRREHASMRPSPAEVLGAARDGVPLFVRTLTLRAVLIAATVTATTMGDASLAAHQVALTVFSTLAFALDALAIAGQALTGRALGAGDVERTRRLTRRMTAWGLGSGVLATVGLLVLAPVLPSLFSSDPAVDAALVPALVVLALMQPVAGIVFVLDGVLIGAGDGVYLAWAGLAVAAAYAPLVAAVWWLDGSLTWLWVAFGGFMVARLVTLVLRERTDRWLVVGTPRRDPGPEAI